MKAHMTKTTDKGPTREGLRVAAIVKRLRTLLGMTQDELASMAGEVGRWVGQFETGINQMTTVLARKRLVRGFGLEINEVEALLEERMSPEDAAAKARPRISERLGAIRARRAGASSDLEAAVRRVRGQRDILPSVEQYCRDAVAYGVVRTTEGWANELERVDREFRKTFRDVGRSRRGS